MSDYPRPPAPSPLPRFLFDRVLGGFGGLYFSVTTIWWLGSNLLRAEVRTYFLRNPAYIPLYLSAAFLFGWGFLLIYKGRRGGFVAITTLLGLILVGAFVFGRMASSLPYFAVWIYCVARLFGLLGPKLLRVV